MPSTVIVFTQEGLDALSGADELEPVLVDAGDRSTWPGSARAVVAAGASSDDVLEVVRAVEGVEVVQTLSAGVETWLGRLPDGVSLVNGRGAHGGATAEWAVTVLLAMRRGIPGFVRQQDRHDWSDAGSPGLQGAHVLVVGAGDLGEQTRLRLDGFGCTVTLVARTAREGVRGTDELPELLPDADAVVLVVPLTDATRGLVDAAFLARMKDGAALVNAARGQVVDTDALLAELQAGRLVAGLDVTDPEPLPEDHPLWDAPGLLLTPHVGGQTGGSTERAWGVVREQLLALARGERPSNTVGDEY
ncbi:2-hydroxyacid dehydrogenase [Aquipuribacter hungaricus]|uniref:2-hydroxyacid dehydrogenase n=1 Tax=Aquipuribacter hungaricus TaxID=545624 RepID=A0ABV7WFI3_9MICO